MTQGKRFLDQCVNSPVQTDPWPHQIIQQTFDESVFKKLRQQCQDNLMDVTGELIQIFPDQFKDHGIEFYDETVDICQNLYDNIQQIQGVYPNYRQYSNLGINAHISVTLQCHTNFIYIKKVLKKLGVRSHISHHKTMLELKCTMLRPKIVLLKKQNGNQTQVLYFVDNKVKLGIHMKAIKIPIE